MSGIYEALMIVLILGDGKEDLLLSNSFDLYLLLFLCLQKNAVLLQLFLPCALPQYLFRGHNYIKINNILRGNPHSPSCKNTVYLGRYIKKRKLKYYMKWHGLSTGSSGTIILQSPKLAMPRFSGIVSR